jgi:hypothetical protein
MKAVLLLPMLFMLNPATDVQPIAASALADATVAIEAPWTAKRSKSDPGKLQLSVMERRGSMLGTGVRLVDFEGLSAADLDSNRPVTFVLRREAGTVTFTGRFRDGEGEGTLRYQVDPGYWSRIGGMGIRNDWSERRYQLLALPLLDVRTDYIAALRREGAMGELSDYVGYKAVNVQPEMVREVKPLIAGEMKPHDLMSFAALGVTPGYAREMRTAFTDLKASDLSSMKALGVNGADVAQMKATGLDVTPQGAAGMKALGVTPAYVAEMRAAGARIRTAGDAQSFRALGISPAAVRRAVERGRPNPTASDVMEMNVRY